MMSKQTPDEMLLTMSESFVVFFCKSGLSSMMSKHTPDEMLLTMSESFVFFC
jgi:hypothetical protein